MISTLSAPKVHYSTLVFIIEVKQNLFIFIRSVDRIEEEGVECEIKEDVVAKYAESIGAQTFRTSAKNGTGVEELFYKIAEDFTRRSQAPPTVYNPVQLENRPAEPQKTEECAC